MRRALVIGFGSIGKRHAQALARAGFITSIVSRRPLQGENRFASVKEALEASKPDLTVICNETSLHRASLSELEAAGYQGPVLVEKPLWQPQDDPFSAPGIRVGVAYVLRFHPVLMQLKSLISGRRAISAEIRCASYLPDWRPGADYRQTKSAKLSSGGGVLRDFRMSWIMPHGCSAALPASLRSADVSAALKSRPTTVSPFSPKRQNCRSLSISINYVGRPTARGVIVNMDEGTYQADLSPAPSS